MPIDEDKIEELRKYDKLNEFQSKIYDFLGQNKGKLYNKEEIFEELFKSDIQGSQDDFLYKIDKINMVYKISSSLFYMNSIGKIRRENLKGIDYYYISKH